MIVNTEGNNKFNVSPNMVKRGFNQTPNDIKDKMMANQLMYKKQVQVNKNKENSLNNTLDPNSKVEALKKINNEIGGR